MLDSSDIPEQGLSQPRTTFSWSPRLRNQDPESTAHSHDMLLMLILMTELGYRWERGSSECLWCSQEICPLPAEGRLVGPMRLSLPRL